MWKMSFCDSDQKSMPIVGFLTCNGSGIFCGPKLIPIGGLDTELISRLHPRAVFICAFLVTFLGFCNPSFSLPMQGVQALYQTFSPHCGYLYIPVCHYALGDTLF